jgi:hypothetical protein
MSMKEQDSGEDRHWSDDAVAEVVSRVCSLARESAQHRGDSGSCVEVVFAITPAERAAVFVHHTLTVRGRENRDESVSINRGIVERVFKSGPRYSSTSRRLRYFAFPWTRLITVWV